MGFLQLRLLPRARLFGGLLLLGARRSLGRELALLLRHLLGLSDIFLVLAGLLHLLRVLLLLDGLHPLEVRRQAPEVEIALLLILVLLHLRRRGEVTGGLLLLGRRFLLSCLLSFLLSFLLRELLLLPRERPRPLALLCVVGSFLLDLSLRGSSLLGLLLDLLGLLLVERGDGGLLLRFRLELG